MNKALDDEGHEGLHVSKLRAVIQSVATVLINDVADWEEA